MPHPDEELIAAALARRPDACRTLVDRLTPPIQRQVNAALIRRGRGQRQDVLDLVQEIFRILLDEDGKILRAWDPNKGATLEGYASIVAQRRTASILASGRKSGHAEDPSLPEDLDVSADDGPDPELAAINRQMLSRVLEELRSRLSDRGFEMFHVLFVEERDVQWVMERYDLNRDAVYGWRARLSKSVRQVARKIASDPEVPRRRQGQEVDRESIG